MKKIIILLGILLIIQNVNAVSRMPADTQGLTAPCNFNFLTNLSGEAPPACWDIREGFEWHLLDPPFWSWFSGYGYISSVGGAVSGNQEVASSPFLKTSNISYIVADVKRVGGVSGGCDWIIRTWADNVTINSTSAFPVGAFGNVTLNVLSDYDGQEIYISFRDDHDVAVCLVSEVRLYNSSDDLIIINSTEVIANESENPCCAQDMWAHGYVSDYFGNNVTSGNISFHYPAWDGEPSHSNTNISNITAIGADGSYSFCIDQPGFYDVALESDGYRQRLYVDFELTDHTEKNFTMYDYDFIGWVKDYNTGLGIFNAAGSLRYTNDTIAEFGVSDANGLIYFNLSDDITDRYLNQYKFVAQKTGYIYDLSNFESYTPLVHGIPNYKTIFLKPVLTNVTINFIAWDWINFEYIPFAAFKIYDNVGGLIYDKVVDGNGSLNVSLQKGSYTVIASKTGYQAGSYVIEADRNKTELISLTPTDEVAITYKLNGTVYMDGVAAGLEPITFRCENDFFGSNVSGTILSSQLTGTYEINNIIANSECTLIHFKGYVVPDYFVSLIISNDTQWDINLTSKQLYTFTFIENISGNIADNLEVKVYLNATYFDTFILNQFGVYPNLNLYLGNNTVVNFTTSNPAYQSRNIEITTDLVNDTPSYAFVFKLDRLPDLPSGICENDFIILPDIIVNSTDRVKLPFYLIKRYPTNETLINTTYLDQDIHIDNLDGAVMPSILNCGFHYELGLMPSSEHYYMNPIHVYPDGTTEYGVPILLRTSDISLTFDTFKPRIFDMVMYFIVLFFYSMMVMMLKEYLPLNYAIGIPLIILLYIFGYINFSTS